MSQYIELTPKLHARKSKSVTTYIIWCPGCKEPHGVPMRVDGGEPSWNFDGNIFLPTITPSLKISDQNGTLCHLVLTKGQIQYQADCKHVLAGQTIEMVDIILTPEHMTQEEQEAKMKIWIGTKDSRIFLTHADDSDTAYLNIGELMNGFRPGDPGNVDLDSLNEIPVFSQTIELKTD